MKQGRLLKSLPTSQGDCTHIDVEVFYTKGGMNYFTSKNERRGLYLSVQPVKRGDRMISFTAFSGVKQFVKEMKMFSQKALNEYVPDPELEKSLIDHVLEKGNIKLQE